MRKEMVTRGVDGTKALVKVVSKSTDLITNKEVILSKDYTAEDKEKQLTKAVTKALTEDEILIAILSTEKVHKLFGLDTQKFMELAIELDPETRKPLAQ